MRPIRVLFVHGLESGPQGTKTRMLRAQGFEVHAVDMHMSLFSLRRSNSALRNALRLAETRVALGAGLLGLAHGLIRRSPRSLLASVVVPGLWLAARRERLVGRGLGRSLEVSVAIQAEALESFEPDVVIGSSFGGAVVAELIIQGRWSGPAILLAPAVEKIDRVTARAGSEARRQRLRERSHATRIVVFHDPSDDTVPFADSERLVANSAIELRSVDAGGHRLLDLLERGELADCVRSIVSAS